MAQTQLSLPPLETTVAIERADIGLSADGVTYMARITFDVKEQRWVIASRLNPKSMRWIPRHRGGPVGLMVFLNMPPNDDDNEIVISSIKANGRAVYADAGRH